MTGIDHPTLEHLLAERAIARLKYAYLRCLDQHRFHELAELFLPEATASYSGGAYHLEGVEEILGFLRRNMDRPTFHSSHRVGQPEIELAADGRSATAVWALSDHNVDTEWNLVLMGSGFYDDVYRVDDSGAWRIAHTGYRRVFETIRPLAAGERVTASWWATDGRSTLPAG